MKRFTEAELRGFDYEEIVQHPFTDAGDLHMGVCNIFAKALQDTYGYEIWHIEYDRSFHDFCVAEKDSQVIYIDATGMSIRLEDLQPGKLLDYNRITKKWVVSFEDEFDWTAYDFAIHFIDRNPEYFDISFFDI